MKAIVLGCGRIGTMLALRLQEEGNEVVVIDKDIQTFSRMENFKGKAILGDGSDTDVLSAAGAGTADMFAAATGKDNTNLMASQIARAIYGVKKVTCLVYCPRRASIYRDLGLDTISITEIGSRLLLDSLLEARTVRRFQVGDGSGIALEVKLGKELEGKTIKELTIAGKFRISSVIRGLNVIIPDDDFAVKTEDHIFGVVLTTHFKELEQKLGIMKEDRKEPENPLSDDDEGED